MKKERWGAESAKWREKCKESKSASCSGQRTVSWEGAASAPQVAWPLWPESRPPSGRLCPHPVTLHHAQEHRLLCGPPAPPSSNIATSRQAHPNTHPSAGRETGKQTQILLWTMRATGQGSFCMAAKPLLILASCSHLWGGHHQTWIHVDLLPGGLYQDSWTTSQHYPAMPSLWSATRPQC